MNKEELNIEKQLFAEMKRAKAGTLFFPEQFSDFAESTAIRKALQRLTEDGNIVRVAQGIYVIPKESSLVGKVIPGAEEVAAAIAKRDRARIVPTGVHALNILGLSTQVPMRVVYLTDGAARKVRVGKQTINFKRTTPKNLAAQGHISGLVIQALKTIGQSKVEESELKKIIAHLKKEKRENILHDSKLAPVWIAAIMKRALTIDE